MAKKASPRIQDIEVAKAVIAHEAVPCVCGIEQAASPQPTELVSCTGGTFWGRRGESWPVTADGRPLIPWLQIVCEETKRPSGPFRSRGVVGFYIDRDFGGYDAASKEDENAFVVREYAMDEELVPLARPAALTGYPFHRVTWEGRPDYPSLSKYYKLFDDDVYSSLCDVKKFKYANRSGIKIGGWPTPVRPEQEYPGSHDLQIDITENYMYADSGIAYLSRIGGPWRLRFDCC